MNYSKYIKENTESLKGKTVAITGSTGGLGGAVCRYVLALGGKLILLDRNPKKAQNLSLQLKSEYPDADITKLRIDLEDIDSVIKCADSLEKLDFDFLILNAGAYSIPQKKTSLGYDNVFQINFISQYYLAKRMLQNLRKAKGKLIVTGSIAHNFSKSDENDIEFKKHKMPSIVYGNSKRYLMFSVSELMKKNPDVPFMTAHPGITPTNITSNYPKWVSAVIKYPMKLIFISPEKAALGVIKAMFSTENGDYWIGPSIFNIWGKPSLKPLCTCGKAESQHIFDIAEKIYSEIESRKTILK